ncbi:MAG: GNAT family N-acetyltransferase [Pseudomonadota bacterium]
MRPAPRLRPARPDEADTVAAIAEAAFGPYAAAIGRRPAPMLADFAAQISAGQLRVLEAESVALGYIVFYEQDSALFVEALALRPDAQGAGHGRRLMEAAEAEARARALPAVALYTNARMTTALAFYPALGYRVVSERREDGFDRIYFEKRLPAD